MKKTLMALAAVLALAGGAFAGSDFKQGSKAPDFSLKDGSGKEYKLSDQKGKIVVLEWTNHGCPFVKKHYETGNMQKLQKEFTKKGVVWFSVNSSAEGKQGHLAPADVAAHVKEQKYANTALLLDSNGKVGKKYGAQTTPHMFVVGADGKMLYAGAIDDNSSHDKGAVKGAKNYVREVLEAALAGKAVTTAFTKSYGCSVKY